jgi:plastocyanin
MRIPARIAAASLLAASLAALPAGAGQVRINVQSNTFVPNSNVPLNQGDHVVFVWISGTHSATSGNGSPSGIFNSGNLSTGSGTAFTWKSDRTGSVPFYCIPHFSIGMTGTLQIAATGTAVSNFRITEVQYVTAAGQDRVLITNAGNAAGNLGRYRVAVNNGTTALTLPGPDLVVPAGGRVILHLGASGTNTATEVFLPTAADLGASGSFALYAPNTVGTALTDANMLVDFVQWGAAGQPNETTAQTAGVWTVGQAAATAQPPDPAVGHSISFCGAATDRGASFWDVTLPNFGAGGQCTTPSLTTSWGRLKTLYR